MDPQWPAGGGAEERRGKIVPGGKEHVCEPSGNAPKGAAVVVSGFCEIIILKYYELQHRAALRCS